MYKINHYYQEFITNREAILASLGAQGLCLKFLWKNPNENIIKTFQSRPFFQLFFKREIMFLLVKFENLKWVDIPCVFTENAKNNFSWVQEIFPCQFLLFNSNTGKLFVKAEYQMPMGVSKAFLQGIYLQKDLDKKKVQERINAIRSSYSACEMSLLSLGYAK